MYSEISQGSKINIQGLDCWIPPAGYIYNVSSKEIEYRGVYRRSDDPEDQYWERLELPSWFKDVTKREDSYERKRKADDPIFFDERYEAFKKQEWDRRLNGFWFMNNGEPCYVNGAHYLFMQWFFIDVGYPKFRIIDLEYFYFVQYCIEDPVCMGALEICKRRNGKSFRGGVFLLDYTTRTKMVNAGIQSKTGGDAKKLFAKAVVGPFKRLPRFFKPEYDMSLGITPKTEIRFQQTNVRGKKAEDGLDRDELNSMIDFQSADEVAYDGSKLSRVFLDEFAKTKEADVYERHDVIRYCLFDDEGRIVGKALYASTVEQVDTEKEGVSKAAIQLWDDSDQYKRGKNGRTPSGLYRFFMTADRSKNFDKYGIPDVDKTIREILEDRDTVKHNQRAWAARVRKEPRTIHEAFYAGNSECEFNAEKLSNYIEDLKINNVYLRQVRIIQKDRVIKSPVPHVKDKTETKITYMDDAAGSWYILEEPNEPNKFIERMGYKEPRNTGMYVMGCDTVKDLDAKEGSEAVALVMKKSCIIDGVETGLMPVAMRISHTRLGVHFDKEIAMACLWYGCKVCYEIDARDDYFRYFDSLKMKEFLEWTPLSMRSPTNKNNKIEPGVRSGNPFQLYQQLQIAKTYVDGDDPVDYNGNGHRIKFPTLLQQLLEYNHAERTKSDQAIALFMALSTMIGGQQAPKRLDPAPLKVLPTYKIDMKR